MSVEALFWALKLKVPKHEKLVAIYLADHANGRHQCWPSKARLALLAPCSKGSVSRALKALEEWGLIEVEAREHVNKKPRSNLYTLRLDRVAPPDAMDGSGETPSPDEEEENDDETTASDDDNSEQATPDSIPRVTPDSMGRSHVESKDGVTQDPTNRNNQLEPSPLPPNASTRGTDADRETSSAVACSDAAGSAGQGKGEVDPNSDEFKRSQFNRLVECWQQAGLIRFAGDEVAAWKIFKGMSLEDRVEALAKAANYLKGKKAEFAEWNGKQRSDRSKQAPKPTTIKDYLGTKLFKLLGMPSEPVTVEKPKPPRAAWIAAVTGAKRTLFDPDAVYVEQSSDAFRAWCAAYRRAGLPPMTLRPSPDRKTQGNYFASEYPPREEDFEQQQEGAAA